jgi:D-alanyl-D-alanine carboxypeptidase
MIKALKSLLALCAGLPLIITQSAAAELNPSLIVDVANGAVLHEEGASLPWYPASLTKLMTVYVTLTAVKERRLTFDTPLIVSQRAARMPYRCQGRCGGVVGVVWVGGGCSSSRSWT